MTDKYLWWQTGIVYQVYPRSYMDSNGDGVGDLPGIRSKLDYLEWLGVQAIWISPCYPSPMADFGYDVSDYCDIHPLFGTLSDFDALLADAHSRGMKVILDFVPNHTSDEHPWFVESRSSRDNPKRHWYIWEDAKPDGSPPNNWLANFGGIAWEWDEATGQYYYHAFLKEQPDLNWRNSEVRAAMWDVLRFWLDRGVDGFRVDVMYHMIKDEQLRDNPPNPGWKEGMHPYLQVLPLYSADQPEVHDVVAEMRKVFDEYDERVIIGEIYLPIPRLVAYYGENGEGAHLPFNFQLLLQKWEAQRIARMIDEYEAALPAHGWPNWVLGNHDRPRVASRVGRAQARVAAMMLLTLRGTPTLYQGDEIAMENVEIPPEKVVDPPGVTLGVGRDPERTPMQWDDSPNAGFTTAAEPWLPVAADYKQYNVAREREDPESMLTLHRRLIDLRQSSRALMVGSYRPVREGSAGEPETPEDFTSEMNNVMTDRYERPEASPDVLAYEREADGERFLVVLNLGSEPASFALGERRGRIALSTHLDREGDEVEGAAELRGDEGLVVRLG